VVVIKNYRNIFLFILILFVKPLKGDDLVLNKNWFLKPSSKVTKSGEEISKGLVDTKDWYRCSIPSTVLSALVKNKVYENIFYGTNLDQIPKQQFYESWWYVTSFDTKSKKDNYYNLRFEGINYRANIWLNGTKIASADTLLGSFRIFEIEVTHQALSKNILALQVFPPKPGDLTIGFVDWAPGPPDRNMGIWRPVVLKVTQAVSIENVFVDPMLSSDYKKAELIINAELYNHSSHKQKVTLKGKVDKDLFVREFILNPYEKKKIKLSGLDYSSLIIHDPKLWWPTNLGEPTLYKLELTALIGKKKSAHVVTAFGIKEVSQYWTPQGFRGFKINGKNILIMGAGYKDNLLLDDDSLTVKTKIEYVKDMNLNCIRVEGMWGNSEYLYHLCDQYGILVMAGFSCQWEWPHYLEKEFTDPKKYGGIITKEEMDLAVHYTYDQLLWLRNHPSLFVWMPGSDMIPRPELEKRYLGTVKEVHPSIIYISAAAERTSEVAGPTGIKMRGPYDYVTPNYWYIDSTKGGAFGFCSESGPGPQLPVMETVKKMVSPEDLWPMDNDQWRFHCGRRHFENMEIYNHALKERYGEAQGVEDYIQKAQWMNYEAMKPTFESYRVNRKVATGLIHWMLNGSWPGTFWQLFDSYLIPNAAYFATKKACQPISVAYNYKDQKLYLLNDSDRSEDSLQVEVAVYNSRSNLISSSSQFYSIDQYTTKEVSAISQVKDANHIYFVFIKIKDKEGVLIADNYYWLSNQEDRFLNDTKKWFVTENSKFADFHYLSSMPKAKVVSRIKSKINEKGETHYEVEMENQSDQIAFNLEMKLVDEKGELIVPVLWEDNYVTLQPKEKKIVKVNIKEGIKPETTGLRVNGKNFE